MITFSNFELLVLGSIPLVLVFLVCFFRGKQKWYTRLFYFFFRALLVGLIIIALANPMMLQPRSALQASQLTILVDNSTSMQPFAIDVQEIDSILSQLLHVNTRTIVVGDQSPLVTSLVNTVAPFEHYLLISDGQATDDDDYTPVVSAALSANATMHTLQFSSPPSDASVKIDGPAKSLLGGLNTYAVTVSGNATGTLRVQINGEEVLITEDPVGAHTIEHTFFDEGTQLVEAHLETQDLFAINNDYYLTTRIVPKPELAYMGKSKPVESFLTQVFDVTTFSSFPSNLSAYSGLVSHNIDAKSFDADTLEQFIGEGNGWAALGGTSAFDFGGYDGSNIAPMLPVRNGRTGSTDAATIVLLIDISAGDTKSFIKADGTIVTDVEKALAYDIVEQLSGQNLIGILAFNDQVYNVADLTLLGQGREILLDKISRLQRSGTTRLNVGLSGAYEVLKDASGRRSVILLSDGVYTGGDNDEGKSMAILRKMRDEGIQVNTVGVGDETNENYMKQIASVGRGSYLRAQESDRLTINFGRNTPNEIALTQFTVSVVDDTHPVSRGISNPELTLNNVNRVIPKTGARVLALTTKGDVALTTWNYGLGRVGTWTAYTGIDDLGGFIRGKDSALLIRLVSWIAGDPERKNPPLLQIPDGILKEPTLLQAHAPSLEKLAEDLDVSVDDLAFLNLQKIDTETYTSKITSNTTGFITVFNTTYGVNYPEEYTRIGQADAVEQLALLTNGKHLKVDDLALLENVVKSYHSDAQIPVSIAWIFYIAALSLFVFEIMIRKIMERVWNA